MGKTILKLCALVIVLVVALTLLGRAIDYEEAHHGPYYQQPAGH